MNWIKVEDKLPALGEWIIGCQKGSQEVKPRIREDNGKIYRLTDYYCADSLEITHWMPLPEPPKP